MHRRRKVDEKSCACVTPAGTSNELDVLNKWEENTLTSSRIRTGTSKDKSYTKIIRVHRGNGFEDGNETGR